MTPDPVAVDRLATLDQALALLERRGFRHLPVVDCGHLVGIVSDRDLRISTAWLPSEARLRDRAGRPVPGARRIHEILRTPVHALPPEASPAAAARAMVERRIGAIPVVEEGRLVGIVTATDLLRLYIERAPERRVRGDGRALDLMCALTCVELETPVTEALDAMDRSVGHVGVTCEGRLVGIASERDLSLGIARAMIHDALAQSEGRLELENLRVQDVMSVDVVTAEPRTTLVRCAAWMVGAGISALPIVERTLPLGILTQRHLLEHLVSTMPAD